jgi:hypothetical protein
MITKGQLGIYGVIWIFVLLVVLAAINPINEQTIANGTATMGTNTMEYLASQFLAIVPWLAVIYALIVFSGIRR